MEKQIENRNVVYTLSEGLTANKISEYSQYLDQTLPDVDSFDEFILNLSQTDTIDSTGVTFIISIYKKMKVLGKKFSISGASEEVQGLFKLMKLNQFFEMRS